MAEKTTRRGFLKTLFAASMGAVASGTGVALALKKQDRIDEIYDVVKRTSQSGMSFHPCVDRKGQMRTGFGTIVSKDDFAKMDVIRTNVSKYGNAYYSDDAPESVSKNDLPKTYDEIMQNGSGRSMDYTFTSSAVRAHTKQTIHNIESDIMKYVPNYAKLPPKAQGLLVQTHIKTDGDLKSYPMMCESFNQGHFNVSEKNLALKNAVNLYDSKFSLDKINQARMTVLKEIQKEQEAIYQKLVQNKARS